MYRNCARSGRENFAETKILGSKLNRQSRLFPLLLDCSLSLMSFTDMAEVAIVSAANSLYFGCVSNLVGSLHRHHPRVKVKCKPGKLVEAVTSCQILLYDLGLNDMERENSLAWKNVELKSLQWDALGVHVQNKRWKAWKPFVLSAALNQVENDAGQVIQQDSVRGYDMCAAGILGLSNRSVVVHDVRPPLRFKRCLAESFRCYVCLSSHCLAV
eukprot:767584-Hanusia_phi.AAC.2